MYYFKNLYHYHLVNVYISV